MPNEDKPDQAQESDDTFPKPRPGKVTYTFPSETSGPAARDAEPSHQGLHRSITSQMARPQWNHFSSNPYSLNPDPVDVRYRQPSGTTQSVVEAWSPYSHTGGPSASAPPPFEGDGCAGARRGAISYMRNDKTDGLDPPEHGAENGARSGSTGGAQYPAYTTEERGLDDDYEDDEGKDPDDRGRSPNSRGLSKRRRRD